jgi:hypothetical protein
LAERESIWRSGVLVGPDFSMMRNKEPFRAYENSVALRCPKNAKITDADRKAIAEHRLMAKYPRLVIILRLTAVRRA